MTINDMRCYILDSYPNASKIWRNKVAFTMRSNQIIAIYKSIVNRGMNRKSIKQENEEYHQIDIFEWLASEEARSDVKGSHSEIAI